MRHCLVALSAGLLLLSACEYTPSALGDWRESPSCGSFENRNEKPSAMQEAAISCLFEALAEGRRAELVATYHGEDGGPITHYFRVLGPRRIEVFVDATEGGEGGRWSHMLCDELKEESGWIYGVAEGCRDLSVDEVVT